MSQSSRRSILVAACLVGIALGPWAHAQTVDAEMGAKALFYNAAGALVSVQSAVASSPTASADPVRRAQAKPAPPAVLALRASVLIVGPDGGTREVKPSHKFSSGDRIKLAFTSNRTGYFYLATVGTSGRVQLLAPRKGEAAAIQAGFKYQYPASPRAYFKFDQQAGAEELWAVLSDAPLDAINLGVGRVAEVQVRESAPAATSATPPAVADATAMASKDLVFEEDADATYASIKPTAAVVPAMARKPAVVLKIVLNHQ